MVGVGGGAGVVVVVGRAVVGAAVGAGVGVGVGAAVGAGVGGVVGAGAGCVVGDTVVSTGSGTGVVVPGTVLLVVVVRAIVDVLSMLVSVATWSSPPVEVMTQMMTPSRNTKTTPITAGMFTFQRSLGGGPAAGELSYGTFDIGASVSPNPPDPPAPPTPTNA